MRRKQQNKRGPAPSKYRVNRQIRIPEVRLIIWGPSQRLLVADKDVQAKIAAMRDAGVVVEACIACATSYGIVDDLKELGLEVKGMGGPLTDILKNDEHLVTF